MIKYKRISLPSEWFNVVGCIAHKLQPFAFDVVRAVIGTVFISEYEFSSFVIAQPYDVRVSYIINIRMTVCLLILVYSHCLKAILGVVLLQQCLACFQ